MKDLIWFLHRPSNVLEVMPMYIVLRVPCVACADNYSVLTHVLVRQWVFLLVPAVKSRLLHTNLHSMFWGFSFDKYQPTAKGQD